MKKKRGKLLKEIAAYIDKENVWIVTMFRNS